MKSSANQKTFVKLMVDGVDDQLFPQVTISFSHPNIESFQKHVMNSVRLFPGATLYDCESIYMNNTEMTFQDLERIVSGINSDNLNAKKTEKMKLLVS